MGLAKQIRNLIDDLEGKDCPLEMLDRLHTFCWDAVIFEFISEAEYQELFFPLARLACGGIDRVEKAQKLEKIYDTEDISGATTNA